VIVVRRHRSGRHRVSRKAAKYRKDRQARAPILTNSLSTFNVRLTVGILAEPRVNVLELKLALDERATTDEQR
jgi:K+-transporting ATPase c subunit